MEKPSIISQENALIQGVLAYNAHADIEALRRVYAFSEKAHSTQSRASGEPYFSHPLAVAHILVDMRMDLASIMTALLHDTVEDTHVTLKDIQQHFGEEIAQLVDGVTKLKKIELQSNSTKQAENFRKLVLAMSNDIRVLLVKLADRLHNMRTLHYITNDSKKRRIARETLEIYAPLSERIGIHPIKDELEDLSFEALNPDERDAIVTRLSFLEEKGGQELINRIMAALKNLLEENSLSVEISGRLKKPYSIWLKMRRQNVSMEQLSDIMAFRIVVDSIQTCYQTLGILHSTYHVMPGRFKDYISTPKPNNYQSLHTTLIGPESQQIEIQIRTQPMHDIAEFGVAAHWHYKENLGLDHNPREYRWLRSLLEIIEHARSPEEFLEHTKLEMFHDQVFCFTPQGDLLALPQGASVVDFAYAIHSEVGNHCKEARVNGRVVPLRTLLKNGDRIEIKTSPTQAPSPSWERMVITGKARANIRKFIRSQQRSQFMDLGKSMLQKALKSTHFQVTEKDLMKIKDTFKANTLEDLYILIGQGHCFPKDITKSLVSKGIKPSSPLLKDTMAEMTIPELLPHGMKPAQAKTSKQKGVSIKGLIPGMAIHFAGCCHPLPGDKIVGIVMTRKGVTIHTYDCDNLIHFQHEPERWIDVSWDHEGSSGEEHVGRLWLVISHHMGSLALVTQVLSKNGSNIVNLKITNRSFDYYDIILDIHVKSTEHLENIMGALRAHKNIYSVDRVRE